MRQLHTHTLAHTHYTFKLKKFVFGSASSPRLFPKGCPHPGLGTGRTRVACQRAPCPFLACNPVVLPRCTGCVCLIRVCSVCATHPAGYANLLGKFLPQPAKVDWELFANSRVIKTPECWATKHFVQVICIWQGKRGEVACGEGDCDCEIVWVLLCSSYVLCVSQNVLSAPSLFFTFAWSL